MAKTKMVMPKTVQVSVDVGGRGQVDAGEDKPEQVPAKRRTSHGIVCVCGSGDVEIRKTISHQWPHHIAERLQLKIQSCYCQSCGRSWRRNLEVKERELPG